MSSVKWMFHATAFGPRYEDLFRPLQRLFGCRVLHLNEVQDPGIERRGGMTWIGDNSIELGEPLGPDAPAQQFIERFGGGMHSFGVQVDDVDEAIARARQFGVEVAARLGPDVAFTRPTGTAGLLVEWAAHRQTDDPRWGAPEPAPVVTPAVAVHRMAFVGAVVADPVRDATLLGQILDTKATVLRASGPADTPWATVALGDCSLALYPLASDEESLAVWGQVCDRPRCIGLGLQVDDIEDSLRSLAGHGVGGSRPNRDGWAVLTEGVPFPVVVGTELLPGDPRLP